MTYDPVTYWSKEKHPAPNDLPGYVKDYITRHIQGAETILDFGIGEGRLLPLFEGKDVTGFDIVDRPLPVPMTKELSGNYDCVVASKVLLHIPPEDIKEIVFRLSYMSKKVIVYDTTAPCTAPHNFRHDFESMVEMNDVIIKGKDILFWYA